MAELETPTAEEKLEQKVTIEDAGPSLKRLVIEVPEARVRSKLEEAYGTLREEAAVPGFRRGRAPRRLLEKRFGDAVRQDAKGQLISESYAQAIEEHDLDVLGEPEIKGFEELELPESGPLTVTIEVEVTPKVELPAFDQIEVNKRSATVTDEMVDEQLAMYRERFGKPQEVAGGPIEAEDFVECELRVLAGEDAGDDAEVIQREPATYVLAHGQKYDYRGHVAGIFVEDLGKRLIGKRAGEELSISMTGPAGHENEKIKGQPITLKLKLNKIERIDPAPLEQVAEQFGVESVEALRQQVRERLEAQSQARQRADMHEQVCDQLLEKVELDLPEGVTARQSARVLRRQAMELAYQGVPSQEIEQRLAELRAGSEDEAKRQLKQFFILDQAAKQLEVDVSEQEMNHRITWMAMREGRRPEKMRQDMQQNGELESLYMQLREQKTLDQILEQAKVTEVDEPIGQAESASKSSGGEGKKKAKGSKKASAKAEAASDEGAEGSGADEAGSAKASAGKSGKKKTTKKS